MRKRLFISGITLFFISATMLAGVNGFFKIENLPGIVPVEDTGKKKIHAGSIFFNHHTFADFVKGSLSDAGGNSYISKKANLQYINLLDLKEDGYLERVTNNDHSGYDAPDALEPALLFLLSKMESLNNIK